MVRLVIVPRVLLDAAMDRHRDRLRCWQSDLETQGRQLCGTEKIVRLPINIAGSLQTKLVQVHHCVLMPLALRQEHRDAPREIRVWCFRRDLACANTVEFVRVQGVTVAQRGGVLQGSSLSTISCLLSLFGSPSLVTPQLFLQPLLQLLHRNLVLHGQFPPQSSMPCDDALQSFGPRSRGAHGSSNLAKPESLHFHLCVRFIATSGDPRCPCLCGRAVGSRHFHCTPSIRFRLCVLLQALARQCQAFSGAVGLPAARPATLQMVLRLFYRTLPQTPSPLRRPETDDARTTQGLCLLDHPPALAHFSQCRPVFLFAASQLGFGLRWVNTAAHCQTKQCN
mmetsp:Transcript_87226/g.251578  ORF Transcript_87226/g.251578 Transcript_87226/m.251578 type:complete len:338 (-) Transcript_87226:30-1043(-)